MSFWSDLFKKKGESVLGLDIGSSSLKVVQLRKEGGQAVLETYGELALGPYGGGAVGQATNLSAEQIVDTLKDLLREANVTATNCGVSIPYARSLLTLVELPYRKDPLEQKTVIELEARKYIPVPISEVQLDWFIVPDREQPRRPPESELRPRPEVQTKVEVLLIAVHNDELKLLQTVTAGAGLVPSFYEIEIFSSLRAVVDEPVKPVMVLDIGAASTKTYIVERGVVAVSHAIGAGSQDVTRAIAASKNLPLARAETLKKEQGFDASPELVFSRIFSEAKRVLVQYESARQTPVTQVVLIGGGGITKDLGTYAKKVFSIDVRVGDAFAKTEAPAFMRPVLAEIGPEFAVAVGLALRKLDET